MDALVDRPSTGRVFEGARRVRLGDVSPAGRLRLDAAVRYLQDLSTDDTTDVDLPDAEAWVVRKTTLAVHRFPRYLEALELATWCSGTGSHWAERRISMRGAHGGHVEAATIWVHLDLGSGRPSRIPDGFEERYGEASGGRKVTARLVHPGPSGQLPSTPWPVRFTDFDVLDHVNNAAYWEAVEEVRAAAGGWDAPLRVELEHHRAIERGAAVALVVDGRTEDGALRLWLLADGAVAASVVARPGTTDG